MGHGIEPTTHPGPPASESRQPPGLAVFAQELEESGGGALKIFISPLATVLSLTQHIHRFKVEAAVTWKIVSSEKKLHLHSISSNVSVKLACWAV